MIHQIREYDKQFKNIHSKYNQLTKIAEDLTQAKTKHKTSITIQPPLYRLNYNIRRPIEASIRRHHTHHT